MSTSKLIELIIQNNPNAVHQNLVRNGLMQANFFPTPKQIYQVLMKAGADKGTSGNTFIGQMLNVPIDSNGVGARELLDMQTQMGVGDIGTQTITDIPSVKTKYNFFKWTKEGFNLSVTWNKALKVLGVAVLALLLFNLIKYTFFKK